MPKKGGPGSRKSLRVEEKAALEAEQAAAVVDAQTAAKEAQAAADAAAEELAVYRAETASAAEAAAQKAAAELSELKEQLEQAKRAGSPVRAGGRANPFEETPAPEPEGEEAFGTPLVRNAAAEGGSSPAPAPGPAVPAAAPDAAELLAAAGTRSGSSKSLSWVKEPTLALFSKKIKFCRSYKPMT